MDFATVQHSPFLQALGSAILNSLWQCFILWLIYETISVSYKSASARFKNNLGTLLLFFSFAWFLTGLVSKIFNQQQETSAAAIPTDFALDSQFTGDAVTGFNSFLAYTSASLPYLSVAYIFLLFFLMSRLFAAYRYVYFISNKRLINPTKELQLFASKVAGEIGITKKIGVWISHHIDVPATIGFIKPVILIPLASINNLSGQQLEAIILHELAHIKRNDYITNLIISVIETILFFNPFVALLSNSIKRERENCCDDFVLQYRYDPHSYASALLRLEQSRMSKLKLAIGAVSGKKQLLSRIKRITNRQVVSRQIYYGQKLIALLLVTACICSVAWLSPKEKKSIITKVSLKQNKPDPSTTKSIDKVQQPLEIAETAKQIEDLPAISVKPVSPQNEPVNLTESGIENLLQNYTSDEEEEKKENPDFFRVENNTAPDVVNLNQPFFFLNESNLKLPPFINIQNFPFQNMNVNIDLSKIDIGKLNENLKEAYKQINTVDWNKLQKEIRKHFPKMKLAIPLQKRQEALFYSDKINALTNFNSLHAQQQYNSKARSELEKEMLQQNSLYALAMTSWNEKNSEIQQAYNKMQQQDERNTTGEYNFNNLNSTESGDNNEEMKAECDQKISAPSIPGKNSNLISIKRIRNPAGVLNEKKRFQFSFHSDDEKSKLEHVISVEIND